MTPPRDPSSPETPEPRREGTGSYVIREYTPVESMPIVPSAPTPEKKGVASTGFIAALSIILGIIIAASAIISGLGKAFFVTRDEYTRQEATYSSEKSELQRSLTRLEGAVSVQNNTIEKQDATLQRLVDKVQTVREEMARRGR